MQIISRIAEWWNARAYPQGAWVPHRLFIVVPVFALLVALSLRGAASDTAASVTSLTNAHSLAEGSSLFSSRADIAVDAGDLTFISWNGSFFLSNDGEQVTVAAITSPVLVSGARQSILVPTGMQWSGKAQALTGKEAAAWEIIDDLQILPEHFVREQLLMPPKDAGVPLDAEVADVSSLSALDRFLMLEHAEERYEEDRGRRVAIALHSLISEEKYAEAVELLHGEAAIFSLPSARAFVPSLLSAAFDTPLFAPLFPLFLEDENRWLLASVHPQTRDEAWLETSTEEHDRSDRWMRALSFVLSDRQALPASVLAREAWGRETADLLSLSEDPAVDAAAALSFLEQAVHRFRDAGLPERTKAYAALAQELISPYEKHLSPSAKNVLQELRVVEWEDKFSMTSVSVQEGNETSGSSFSSSSSSSSFSSDALLAQARQDLQSAGGLFTVQTEISSLPDGRVGVVGIAFATAQGDRLHTFIYDPRAQEVSDISVEGQIFPYALPLQKFLEWVRGE